MKKTALIFGSSGMDGKTLGHFLLNKGYNVLGTYRRTTINVRNDLHSLYAFHPNIKFLYCNIADAQSVEKIIKENKEVSEVYILAAQSHVGFSFDAPSISSEDGLAVYYILRNVMDFIPKAKVYFAATSELFGGNNPTTPYNENSPFDPRSPYAIYKEVGTRWIKYYRQLGLFACYGILFNHSNEYRGLDFFIRRVTNTAAKIKLGLAKDLVLGNLEFSRDEHWSDFGCEMMWKMLQREEPKDYVIATGKTYTGEDYLNAAFNFFDLDWQNYVKIDHNRFRPNEVKKLIGDSTLAQKDLGWNPNRMSFESHIGLMCKYDLALESGKNPVKSDVFNLFK